ncbi:hypothetical protein AB1L42_21960 [Thalassoglobus sp. JC818]|uniref:hypothetical protein n=1 Tax=Thalassoglobus sp. JC818 TaxID=3232136 RepID=UPI003459F60B
MQLQAIDCQTTAIQTGLRCDRSKPIHQLDNPSVNTSCEADGPDECVAGEGSQCESLEGYEVAKSGECIVDIYYPYAQCRDNFGPTWVPLRYVYAKCEKYEGTCSCVTYYGSQHPSQYSEVCDCL